MKESLKDKKLWITLLLVFVLGAIGHVIAELRLFKQYQDIIFIVLLFFIGLSGYFYWKSLKITWILNLWLLKYGLSFLIFSFYAFYFHLYGWKIPNEKQHISTLSPVFFIVLVLLNILAKNEFLQSKKKG